MIFNIPKESVCHDPNCQCNSECVCRPKCHHDYENPIRKGRAHYVCQKCGADITLELVLMMEAGKASESLTSEP